MKIQREVKVNAQHRCQVCQSTSALEIHHIDENRENNIVENLILLCATCHSRVHKGDIDRKALKIYRENQRDLKIENNKDELVLKKLEEILSYQFIASLQLNSYLSNFNDNTFFPFEKFLEECHNPRFKFSDKTLEDNRLSLKKKIEYVFNMIGKYRYEPNNGMYRIGPTERTIESEGLEARNYWSKVMDDFNFILLDINAVYQKFF